jgi:hypothetical protein
MNKAGGSLREDYPIVESLFEESDVPGKEKHQRNIKIVRELLRGNKQKDVAELFGISSERVRQVWILTALKQHKRLQKETEL